jgi:tRNA threonylcarbamoyladenosine biosynthesis protein TsaB
MEPTPERVTVCDEAAAKLLHAAWPETDVMMSSAPTAADALRLGAERLAGGEQADLALLDGHYLRRSDAEIFGEQAAAGLKRA